MADCMYIVTQGELDELETYLEWYKIKEDLKAAAEKAAAILSEAFAQVALSVEEILKGFSDWYLEITGDAPEIYKPRTKHKRPQRKILLRYEPLLDQRRQVYKMKTWRLRHDHR